MSEVRDFMFGDNILPEVRLQSHRSSLAGVQHRMDASPLRPRSGQVICLRTTTCGEQPYRNLQALYTLDGSPPQPGSCHVMPLHPAEVTWDEVDWKYVQHWEGWLPAQADDTLIRYRIAAQQSGVKGWVYADNQATDAAQATNFALWVSDIPAPAWVERAMVYHVFIDRFYPGEGKTWLQPDWLDGFCGGTIQGVLEKLNYIQGLGYNTLWLSPFFSSPSHHGYDATDMYQVEARLGTNEDLYWLIETVHQRGMRLILDFVANHWSNQHPSLVAAQQDQQSPYYDWYFWKNWPDKYEGFFGVQSMPKLNLSLGSPARQYMLDCAQFWLEKGFDGFRLDFAYGPPIDFWVDFRRTCKRIRPDCWLFGEVIHSAPVQRSYSVAFDGVIDFLLAEALRQTFGYSHWQLDQFDAYLNLHEAYFEGLLDRLTILDNHDMNRFLFLSGNDKRRLKLGALLIYTLAGNPINYYGTEVGVTQERPTHYNERGFFEEARQPMLWDGEADPDLLETFQRLTALRHSHPALRSAARRTVHLDPQRMTYAYQRELDGITWLVAFNLSKETQRIRLPGVGTKTLVDHVRDIFANPHPLEIQAGSLVVVLPPMSGSLVSSG